VALAGTIGLLLSTVPLVQSALEYRSPDAGEFIQKHPEFASTEAFALANTMGQLKISVAAGAYEGPRDLEGSGWRAMRERAIREQIQYARRRARNDMIAYGISWVLCVVLAIIHLTWARRLS